MIRDSRVVPAAPAGCFVGMISALFCLVLFVPIPLPALAAEEITGTVRNQTQGAPAAGNDVILLRLDRGMIEEARTKTDAQGAFSLEVQHPEQPHLVRAIHQSVVYDQRVTPGERLSISVFDSASKVQGITGNAEIMRVSSKADSLHVSDMFDIDNQSTPPMTQASGRTVMIRLDAVAKIDTVLAAGPGGIGVLISAVPEKETPGVYALDFPLRPGVTKFAVNYDLPYTGKATFHPQLQYPVQQFAVMFPLTMKFTSPGAFHALATSDRGFQVQALSKVRAGAVPAFQISGNGTLPRAAEPTRSQPPPAAVVNPSPRASSLPNSAQTAKSQPSTGALWTIALLAMLASAAIVTWQVRRSIPSSAADGAPRFRSVPSAVADGSSLPATTREALKEELFRLEADRLRGSISPQDYTTSKRTLEKTIASQIG